MGFASLSLFAQSAAPEQIGFMVGYFIGQFIGVLLISLIVSGILHLFSRMNPKLAFGKVFPYVFVVVLVLGILGQLLPH
jgi:hypothetical protein